MMLCHWTGIHWSGQEKGFKVLQEVVRRLHARFNKLIWMKLSELSRYWATRELTRIESTSRGIALRAPFACPGFTLQCRIRISIRPKIKSAGREVKLRSVGQLRDLEPGTCHHSRDTLTICFDLLKGDQTLELVDA